EKVRMAADARISAVGLRQATSEMAPDDRNRGGPQIDDDVLSDALIFIGASTGGTQAIKEVLQQLPHRVPGIVIVQHIPPVFSSHFASRLNTLLSLNVSEAREGQRILPGHVYVAPGDRHLRVARDQGGYYCTLDDGAPVNRHIPSVDVLFRSAVDSAGADAVGVLLTGMGSDGAEGLGAMQRAGAATIAQDEKTSVVWGMPGSAVELGAADQVLPLGGVAKGIVSALQQSGPAQGRAGYRTGS
ncbi:MAG: CheB methylesterase domain-containing protein, partial [Thiohalobacterales bacterium]|nr:CheB methylesterase domain-containing protein [Thiohalobacterales bacterium]